MKLNCNQTILLLDCHRGYKKHRHDNGQHQADIEALCRADLIQPDYTPTTNGAKLIAHLLNEARGHFTFIVGSPK